MQRVVVLGRGAAGKSVLADRLAVITGLPAVHLDELFWTEELAATSPPRWAAVQRDLVAAPAWILDGDLGPYDVLDVRLRAADTVVMLDFSLVRCLWQALRRSRERADFWAWVIGYRRRWRPRIVAAIARDAPTARVHVLRGPRAVERFVDGIDRG